METLQSIDFSILDWIQQTLRCDFLDYVMAFFSYIGQAGAVWIVAGVTLLFFRKTRATGLVMLAAMLFGYLLGDLAIKPLVQRPRPFAVHPDIRMFIFLPHDFSFPSGHSCCAAAAATVLLVRERKLGFIALPVALLIMFSRLYHYVHFPSDVLCGMVLGILSGMLMLLIARAVKLDSRLGKLKAN